MAGNHTDIEQGHPAVTYRLSDDDGGKSNDDESFVDGIRSEDI